MEKQKVVDFNLLPFYLFKYFFSFCHSSHMYSTNITIGYIKSRYNHMGKLLTRNCKKKYINNQYIVVYAINLIGKLIFSTSLLYKKVRDTNTTWVMTVTTHAHIKL